MMPEHAAVIRRALVAEYNDAVAARQSLEAEAAWAAHSWLNHRNATVAASCHEIWAATTLKAKTNWTQKLNMMLEAMLTEQRCLTALNAFNQREVPTEAEGG